MACAPTRGGLLASATKRAEHDQNAKPDEHRRDDGDDRPRQPVAGRFDPEQHGGAQQKGDDASKAEHHGRIEGLDDEERDAEQHQARPA